MLRFALILTLLVLSSPAQGQGTFEYINLGFDEIGSARTRLGSLDGEFAGTNVLGQMWLGRTPDSLAPLGLPLVHHNGIVNGGNVTVSGYGFEVVYVQLMAWDSLLWGSSFANVPSNQIGRTDIVALWLTIGSDSPEFPRFHQPAIVPVPEPSVFALLALGGAVAWAVRRKPR